MWQRCAHENINLKIFGASGIKNIFEITCERRLLYKKLFEILLEVTINQYQHFLRILIFYSSAETEKMLVTCSFEKILKT